MLLAPAHGFGMEDADDVVAADDETDADSVADADDAVAADDETDADSVADADDVVAADDEADADPVVDAEDVAEAVDEVCSEAEVLVGFELCWVVDSLFVSLSSTGSEGQSPAETPKTLIQGWATPPPPPEDVAAPEAEVDWDVPVPIAEEVVDAAAVGGKTVVVPLADEIVVSDAMVELGSVEPDATVPRKLVEEMEDGNASVPLEAAAVEPEAMEDATATVPLEAAAVEPVAIDAIVLVPGEVEMEDGNAAVSWIVPPEPELTVPELGQEEVGEVDTTEAAPRKRNVFQVIMKLN
ncbi:hypothetical protein G7Y89_g11345 [Cudoniella acicularis]|uniref:Uncharacterized protein n=1 Tax=Cudoniella acicularis TaxID=354080 RepID=A0A8H4RCI0_9HELO|nr:hypothetical protein G7Y89_g11345 [Cudoniella acicularis]